MSKALKVFVNQTLVCDFDVSELPSEKTPSIPIPPHSEVHFVDENNSRISHTILNPVARQIHLSVRVHASKVCQPVCAITEGETYTKDMILKGQAEGIRFQGIFLPGAPKKNSDFAGTGLFSRGLHYPGSVTPGNITLSCICDECAQSFQFRSFHAGFSNCFYYYSDSGRYVLMVNQMEVPQNETPGQYERKLPAAPDSTSFRYMNPFRCPHCKAAFIDFQKFPAMRETEYYGNYFLDALPISLKPSPTS